MWNINLNNKFSLVFFIILIEILASYRLPSRYMPYDQAASEKSERTECWIKGIRIDVNLIFFFYEAQPCIVLPLYNNKNTSVASQHVVLLLVKEGNLVISNKLII